MSTAFKTKAQEIKEEAAAQRGNFNPTGAPLKMYKYWLAHSKTKRARDVQSGDARENFCHFWRVVAIWVPLMFMRRKVMQFIESPYFWGPVAGGALALAIYVLVVFDGVALGLAVVLGSALAIILGAAGIVGAISLGMGEEKADTYDLLPPKAAKIAVLLGFPLAIPILAVFGLVHFLAKHAAETKLGATLFGGMGAIALVTAVAIETGILTFLMYTGITLAAMAVVVLCAYGAALATEYLRARAEVNKRRREQAETVALADFYEKHGHYPAPKNSRPLVPLKIRNFVVGLGDFIVLVAQIVRTKKWGICPLVEVDKAA